MLAEALHYARARLAGQPGTHGHLAEQVGIWARHRRQRLAWAEHLACARRVCLCATDTLPADRRRTALVLGAGLLNDVPLDALSRRFRRVVLADMAFLPATCRLAKALGNVSLLHADLTGVLDRLPDADALRAGNAPPLPDIIPRQCPCAERAELDFVYSANVLSQLPVSPLRTLRKRHPDLPEEMLDAFGASIVVGHLQALSALDCTACLVTDVRERGQDRHGQTRYAADLLHGVVLERTGEGWTWRIAPRGEQDPHLDIVRDVFACTALVWSAPPGAAHAG
jgi:hypothetical protein